MRTIFHHRGSEIKIEPHKSAEGWFTASINNVVTIYSRIPTKALVLARLVVDRRAAIRKAPQTVSVQHLQEKDLEQARRAFLPAA